MMNEEKGPLLSRKQPKDDTPKPNQNSRHSIDDDQNVLNISIQPEIFRFYAYVFFWMMAIFAIILTEYITADHLLQGPKPGEPACPPFDRFGGRGFDIHKESHLIEAFGFNNVCSHIPVL